MWRERNDSKHSVIGEHSSENRPDILLIHGAGCTAQSMNALARAMDGFANTAAVNLPGRVNPEQVIQNIGELSAFLAGFVTASGNRPWLLGHSLGAAVALEFAGKWSDLIAGIILCNASAILPLNDTFMQRLQDDVYNTMRSFLGKAYGPSSPAHKVEEGIAVLCSLPPSTVIGDFRACRTYDARPYLSTIQVPALIITGEADIITKPIEGRQLHDAIKESKLASIPDSGHMGPLEAPDALAKEIKTFLASLLHCSSTCLS